MHKDEIKRVAVIGAGLMGHGIAQEFALGGYQVRMNDLSEDILQRAVTNIGSNLQMLKGLGLVNERQAAPVPDRIQVTTSLERAVADADLVVEAVSEDLPLKRRVFSELDRSAPSHAILASNTSGYLPSQIAEATERPEKVLVAHYINPPFLIPLVEVVPGPQTSSDAVQAVSGLLTSLGKRPVVLHREAPGFVVNRLQIALLREAVSIVSRGIASHEDVDLVVSGSFGRRLATAGPFQVFDIAGWDVITSLFSQLAPEIDSSTEAPAMLRQMVQSGDLGVKSGRGFYTWTPESASELRGRIARGLVEAERLSQATGPAP